MYPIYGAMPSKNEISQQDLQEKLQKLEKLNETIQELEKFRQFDEINELLIASKALDQNEKNIYLIDVTINKINNLIHSLIKPAQDKINQLKFLMTLIEKYFDQSQVNSINSVFARHKNKLQEEIEASFINREAIDNRIIKIEQLFTNELETILKKMRTYVQDKKVTNNYETYKLEVIKILEKKDDINKQKNITEFFSDIEFLENSIAQFEASHQQFKIRQEWIDFLDTSFQKTKLLETDAINKTKLEIQTLINNLRSFDPRLKSFDILDNELRSLSEKLNELHQLNQDELQKQRDQFIKLIEASKQDFASYAEKLSLLKSKCAHNKSAQLKIIIGKTDLLLNAEINREDNASSQAVIDNISGLKQTIHDAENILSEYRGISLLSCFATLWGGGKVTSKLLVDELEVKLTGLQDNIRFLSP